MTRRWVVALLLAGSAIAWHHPPHAQITRAAVLTLAPGMRQKWAVQERQLIEQYCLYPDMYHGATGRQREEMRPFCEKPGGGLIHNVTWNRGEDRASLEYLLHGVAESVRSGSGERAARFAGVLAHFLEDSTCPAHALMPADTQFNLFRDLFPPPPSKADVALHTVIERSVPEFDLGARAPLMVGRGVGDAAQALLERLYGVIRENRHNLRDVVRAVYEDDEGALDRYRRTAAIEGARLLADSYYTAFVLSGETPASAVVGVKLLRKDGGAGTASFRVRLPEDCSECGLMQGPVYEGQNGRELFFHLRVPVDRPVLKGVRVDTGGTAVRAVVVEKEYIAHTATGAEVMFDVPIRPRARSSTVEVQTNLDFGAVVVRVEHAFEDRRGGKYATGRWPATEVQAALNLEFGMAEATRVLGLDRYVQDNGLGKLHLMGFDTNNPLGHEDYPPHVHMILRWPNFAGSQAPHLYLDERGLLTGNTITVDGMPHITATKVDRDKWVPTVDYRGNRVYEIMITAQGWLKLHRSRGNACVLRPAGAGFHEGVSLECDGQEPVVVRASDEVARGVLKVTVGSRPPEIFRYDPDTAVLVR